MKSQGVHKKLFGLALAAVAVLAIIGIFIHLSLLDRESYRWVNHAFRVQAQVQTILFDIEAGQDAHKEFSISHHVDALRAGAVAFQKAELDLDGLARLVADNPSQIARLRSLRSDFVAYGAQLEATTKEKAQERGSSALVQEFTLLDNVHRSADSMKQAEEDNLAQRTRDHSVSERRVDIAFLCFLLVVGLLLVWLFLTVQQDLRQQREAEQARHAADKSDLLHKAAQRRNQELQDLAHRMVEMQEAERGHLAYELHEEVGQVLTGLKLSLAGILKVPDDARENYVQTAQNLVSDLMRQIRVLSLDLRPGVLDDFGLVPALEWYFKRYSEQTEVAVDLAADGFTSRLDGTVETTAYRIVQEALSSAARRPEVKSVEVQLALHGEYLDLQITGRDVGLAGENAAGFGDHSSLAGMQERAALIGGTFEMQQYPEQGTTILARLPIHPVYTSMET